LSKLSELSRLSEFKQIIQGESNLESHFLQVTQKGLDARLSKS